MSHDAAAPQFYRFMKDERALVMLTDHGLCQRSHGWIGQWMLIFLIESNHDIEILRERCLPAWNSDPCSDLGHLSNEDGAETGQIRTLGTVLSASIWGI